MNSNTELLNHIHKSAEANQDSLRQCIGISQDNSFAKVLLDQLGEYQKIQERSAELINDELRQAKSVGQMEKGFSNFMLTIKTVGNNKPAHIADILIKNSKDGIEDLAKKINKYNGADSEILDLANTLINTETKTAEQLKRYL